MRSQQQIRTLIQDFLTMYPGQDFDASGASIEMQLRWGLKIDWHEFSYILDEWARTDRATIVKPGGFVRYRIGK